MRRSPRESTHSISASRGSCHLSFAPRTLRNRSFRYASLRSRTSTPSKGAHWKGVHDFGTNDPIETLTSLRPWRRPCLRMSETRVTSSSRSGRCLGRQPDHRVDLDQVPAAREREVRRLDHVGVRERLVDDAAQPVGAGLRREREPRLAHFGDRVGEAHGEGLGAQRRQRDRHAAVGELRREALHERLDLRVVGRRERQQPHLAPARLRDELLRHVGDVAGIELAHRPVPVAGLAEAASLRAAAHDLEAEPVLHDLDGGHHRLLGVVLGLQDRHPGALRLLGRARVVARDRRDAAVLGVRDVVEGRDVDALDLREAARADPAAEGLHRAPRGTHPGTAGALPRRRRSRTRRRNRRSAPGWRCTARRRGRSGPRRAGRAATPGSRRGRACSGCSSS